MTYEYESTINSFISESSGDSDLKTEIEHENKEVYRKAKVFDKLVNFYPQKDELPSDEFCDEMGYIIEEANDET